MSFTGNLIWSGGGAELDAPDLQTLAPAERERQRLNKRMETELAPMSELNGPRLPLALEPGLARWTARRGRRRAQTWHQSV